MPDEDEPRQMSVPIYGIHCTQQISSHSFGPSIFSLYSMHYFSLETYVPVLCTRELLSKAKVAYDPFRCKIDLVFPTVSAKIQHAMQEGWILFIHLFKIALFIERVAGEWRLIDGLKNCGIIKTAQRSFSLSSGAFIHL